MKYFTTEHHKTTRYIKVSHILKHAETTTAATAATTTTTTTTELDDSRTSMPALARPCTSGIETSKHMQVTCWHCGCWDHYECVDNLYLSPYRTGGKWLPWFLRKSRPFIFKYRHLGPTFFNIWGIFTIVGIFLIKWYNIPLMHFASLTIEGTRPLIMPTTDFHQKIEK